MSCVIPRKTFNSKANGGKCDIYSDSVLFRLTLYPNTVNSKSYFVCAVSRFDSVCNGTLTANACACREIRGGYIVIDHNVTAFKARYEGACWECIPQCLDSAADATIFNPPDTPECANISFCKYEQYTMIVISFYLCGKKKQVLCQHQWLSVVHGTWEDKKKQIERCYFHEHCDM